MKNILVVDDDTTNLISAKNALDEIYKVIPVPSGVQAVKYLEEHTCSLILLDVEMPEMNGIDTLRKIREMENGKTVPVIFLTANRQKETVIEGSKLGIVDYITKPFTPGYLRERISEIFRGFDTLSLKEEVYPIVLELHKNLKDDRTDLALYNTERILKLLRD